MAEWVDVTAPENWTNLSPDFFLWDGSVWVFGDTGVIEFEGFLEVASPLVGLKPTAMRITYGPTNGAGSSLGNLQFWSTNNNSDPFLLGSQTLTPTAGEHVVTYPDFTWPANTPDGFGATARLEVENFHYIEYEIRKIEFFMDPLGPPPSFWTEFKKTKEVLE